jgi:hypothetical protein
VGYYFIEPSLNFKEQSFKRSFIVTIFSLLACLCAALLYFNQSHGLSLIFNLALLAFFNVYVYVASKKAGYEPNKSVGIFNALYIASFVTIDYLSQTINQGFSLFGNIIDPVSMTRFIPNQPESINLISGFSLSVPFPNKAQNLVTFLINPALQLVTKISSSTIFLLFSLGYFFRYKRELSKKIWLFGGFCLFSYYCISLVNSIRYENAYHYIVFQEFFLLVLVLLLISRMTTFKAKILALSLLIFVILLVNLVPYTHYYNWLARKGKHPFCTSGPVHDHQRMDMAKIRLECASSKDEN